MSVMDKLEVKINAKIDVPKETAEVCAKILEIWANADSKRFVETQLVGTDDRYEQRIIIAEVGEPR